MCFRLRISGNLPAPIVNGGGDRLGKVQLSVLQKPRDLDLNLGWGHTAYRMHQSSSYIPNFIEIGKKNFVDGRTDVLTDVLTDGRTFPL